MEKVPFELFSGVVVHLGKAGQDETLPKVRGEICASSVRYTERLIDLGQEAQTAYLFKVRSAKRFSGDVWSYVDEETGLRIATGISYRTDYDEIWFIPAESELIAVMSVDEVDAYIGRRMARRYFGK